jgi:hypothetical protein
VYFSQISMGFLFVVPGFSSFVDEHGS